ncbi:MAG: hypothetical protein N2376_01695, partial [Clostridia bacterium]|nr:hypothetical protein [Clostridia bacterium]
MAEKVKIGMIPLPTWYTTERDAGRTIQRLTSTKELAFYLQNPDAFIRRLAILRLGELEQKECYQLLNAVFDDALETEDNRQLAAFCMQKLNDALNLGYFLSHSYLARFSSDESPETGLQAAIHDTLPDIRFNFENNLIDSQLSLDNEFLKSNLDEKDYVFTFSYKEWFLKSLANATYQVKKGAGRLGRNTVSFLFVKGPRKAADSLHKAWHRMTEKRKAAHTKGDTQTAADFEAEGPLAASKSGWPEAGRATEWPQAVPQSNTRLETAQRSELQAIP